MYKGPTLLLVKLRPILRLKTGLHGYEEISQSALKYTTGTTASILTYIINLSLKNGRFPEQLQRATSISTFKPVNKIDINHCCPISKIPSFTKVSEKIPSLPLISYLQKNTLITNCHHGFRENCSTETTVLCFEHVYKFL